MDSDPEELPPLQGFDDSGDAVFDGGNRGNELATGGRRSGACNTRGTRRASGEELEQIELLPPTRRSRAFRSRSGTDPLAAVPEDQVLERHSSLEWDGYGGNSPIAADLLLLDSPRRWSIDTHFSVSVAQPGSVLESLSSSSEGGYQSPDSSIAQVGSVNGDEMAMDAAALRRKVERAIMEADEDVLLFQGRTVTLECLIRLSALATSLKKELQNAHMELADDPVYQDGRMAAATECRKKLAEFLVELEAERVPLEQGERTHRQEAAAAAAAAAAVPDHSQRHPVILRRAAATVQELELIEGEVEKLLMNGPKTDEELYGKLERLQGLDERRSAALDDGKELIKLTLEHNLLNDSAGLEKAISVSRSSKTKAQDNILEWRKQAGLWTEKKKRGTGRTDLKAPTFSPSLVTTVTVYEFKKEWIDYRSAMDLSTEEALKSLKQAIQQPSRGDIINLKSEEEVFAYLVKHYGNPMMLLNAREKEVRGWSNCRGTDLAQREWLVQAKSKLESLVRMCRDHEIERYLHFSSVAGEVQSKFPPELTKDFKLVLKKHLSPSGILEKEKIIGLLIEFLEDKILDCTLGVNLDIVNYLGSSKSPENAEPSKQQQQQQPYGGKGKPFKTLQHNQQDGGGGGNGGGGGSNRNRSRGGSNATGQRNSSGSGGGSQFQIDNKCLACNLHHSHMFYCQEYICADMFVRFEQVKKQHACARCLGMKVKLTGRRRDWHPWHEKYCKTDFVCNQGLCGNMPPHTQFHITLCKHHTAENKFREADFIASLDAGQLPPGSPQAGLQFLHMGMTVSIITGTSTAPAATTTAYVSADGRYEVLPDISENAVFMMQRLPTSRPNEELLAFYDSGCGGAGMSERAYQLLETSTVRAGPTLLDVAGGRTIEIPYGDEQFTMELEGGKQLATLTALRMLSITTPFPLVRLLQAWTDLQQEAYKASNDLKLPEVDEEIGGTSVDLILGIKYLKYFPQLVFNLPSGLAVYRARFRSASGRQAVLGGPHAAWSNAVQKAGHMNPRVYFTSEARAWQVEQTWVRINQDKMLAQTAEEDSLAEAVSGSVACICHSVELKDRELWKVEAVGAESPYRCAECRNCQKCKRGDILEEVSFKEEAEQALIDASIELVVEEKKLLAELPFIENPATSLTANRFIAEKVLKCQMDLFSKRPDMKEDTIRSHNKLVARGYVKKEEDLTHAEKRVLEKFAGPGYYIPWRIVHNEGSLSTPCRMVFDASSKTPGGNSLNGILAKGKNKLVKLQNLLARFRQGLVAFSSDISMAYNGTSLKPEYYKFQRYLWREMLDNSMPITTMFVTTLIYGVKPSGAQCQASLEKLAEHSIEEGRHLEGARVLKEEVYVDDIMASATTREEVDVMIKGVEEILEMGSMKVKAFTISGEPPAEAVSADGIHVGLGGYLWRPESDQLLLAIGPLRLGKARRGKLAQPVTGDFGEALKACFTRRTVTGLVARVFDPLGLATPITASLKLDLHDLCHRKLDWDDPIPVELLSVWSENMCKIQELRDVVFKRTVIPTDAASAQVDLLVAVDASQHLGVAAVYARVKRRSGTYSCQLMLARSKIMSDLTIPRAEMRSAVIGAVSCQVIKNNLGKLLGNVMYVTDSTICLHWISQDDRPLQVAVRNAVIEVRRFSSVSEWFHVESHLNVADLGTRSAAVGQIGPGQPWQEGQSWMQLEVKDMPVKTAEEIVLSAEEKRLAAVETRGKDVRGHTIHTMVDKMAARYALSNYVVDPCRFSWTKVVRVTALVMRFVNELRERATRRSKETQPATDRWTGAAGSGEPLVGHPGPQPDGRRAVAAANLQQDEIKKAELYFFRLATLEVKKFSKERDYKDCSSLQDGVLYFMGRILDSMEVNAMEVVMFDLNPLSFCKPMVDRFSPIAYSIMVETHWKSVNHLNATCTFRESLSQVHIIGGRELAQEVRETCVFCKRYRARLQQVEMGKLHETRLTVAPPFTICQVDLMGPFIARCEHNHRSSVKVWGAVFKDPASGAIFVHAMSKCDTGSFLQAYTRFAARFCHPQRLYPDAGSQLLKACEEMQVSWVDVAYTLNAQHGVGVDHDVCPVGGHNHHGMVERSIREVKKLFYTVYANVKLDVLGFETAFNWVSNELNNLPICLGTRYRNLDHLDLLTPNRLIHGRANKRALSGCCMIGTPSAMLSRMHQVFESWWRAWYDEKLSDYIAKPAKWLRSDENVRVGDIVVFLKTGEEQVLGQPIWRVGRIRETEVSEKDGRVRTAVIEYKNAQETVFRTTRRSVRKLAVLHREGDLELVQEINAAAREAERLVRQSTVYFEQQFAVFREVQACGICVSPFMCMRHYQFFEDRPFLEPGGLLDECVGGGCEPVGDVCQDEVCDVLRIHMDPWK